MTPEKIIFFKSEYLPLLRQIKPDTQPAWGKMNFQQMVEHMSDSIRIANGKDLHTLHTPAENVDKLQAFAMSDRPFKENTKNVLIPDEPVPHRNKTLDLAFAELQKEIDDFILTFRDNPEKTILNPFFGNLNFNQWVQLLHKHAHHHLKQFGIPNPK